MPTLMQCIAIIVACGAGAEVGAGGSWAVAAAQVVLALALVRTDNVDREEHRDDGR